MSVTSCSQFLRAALTAIVVVGISQISEGSVAAYSGYVVRHSAVADAAVPVIDINGYAVRGVCPNISRATPARVQHLHEALQGGQLPSGKAAALFERPFFLPALQSGAAPQQTEEREADISLAIPVTLQGWSSLVQACRSWPGSISMALYVPYYRTQSGGLMIPASHAAGHAPLQQELAELLDLQGYIHGLQWAAAQRGVCTLKGELFLEELPADPDASPEIATFYGVPVNALRNRAMLDAPAELVALIDLDMAGGPFGVIWNILHGQDRQLYERLSEALTSDTVGVVPVFMPTGDDLHRRRATAIAALHAETKSDILAMLSEGLVSQFKPDMNTRTDINTWAAAEHPYPLPDYTCADIDAGEEYQPALLVRKTGMPLWDERVRAWPGGRMPIMAALAAQGRSFVGIPYMFFMYLERLDLPTPAPASEHLAAQLQHHILVEICGLHQLHSRHAARKRGSRGDGGAEDAQQQREVMPPYLVLTVDDERCRETAQQAELEQR